MIDIGAFSVLQWVYLLCAVAFVLTLQGLGQLKTAFRSNVIGCVAMGIVAFSTLLVFLPQECLWVLGVACLGLGIGFVVAKRVPITALPELMAAFHSLVGLAAVLIAAAVFKAPQFFGIEGSLNLLNRVEMSLGGVIGALTFTGSVAAYFKLQGRFSRFFRHTGRKTFLNMIVFSTLATWIMFLYMPSDGLFITLLFLGFSVGLLLVAPIGGADMPVVVSMLNSYSGFATVGIGFTLTSFLLVIVGSLVGASGAILSYIMCKEMNRPFLKVLFGGTASKTVSKGSQVEKSFKKGGAEDAAFLLKNAQSVVIVPGYGMAVARAQHVLKEVVDVLNHSGVQVNFAIHPVAGRMPGHMNVLLAEAEIESENVKELEDINSDFSSTDVVLVIGANDITNPSARYDESSPLYGMSILDVDKAKTILFIKRSLSPGYAGVDNPLFYADNTYMLLGDGKKVMEGINKALAA